MSIVLTTISNNRPRTSLAFRQTCLACLLVASVSFIWCGTAEAQKKSFSERELLAKYAEEIPPATASADDIAQIKRDNRDILKAISDGDKRADSILQGGGNTSDQAFVEYFRGYVFPSMTRKENLNQLGERRALFFKNYLNTKVKGQPRNGLIDLTINEMQGYCTDTKLHPAARLNAVYMIGMLDSTPADRLAGVAPVPAKAAFDSLKTIFTTNDPEKFPPSVKVAALAGLHRHVSVDSAGGGKIAAGDKQQLYQSLIAILNRNEKDDLTYWLKRRSTQMLGMLGNVQAVDPLLAILKSKEASTWLKLDCVEAIGKLPMRASSPAKNLEAAIAISDFLANSYDMESKSIQKQVDDLVYDNLLFGDVDLLATGTNYEAGSAATSATPGTGAGAGNGGLRSGGAGGGGAGAGAGTDMGMGMPGDGGVGPDGGAGGAFGATVDTGPGVELPTYKLNVIRRRIKALAFKSRMVLGGELGDKGVIANLDADAKSNVLEVFDYLKTVLEESNAGIIDREKPQEEPGPGEDEPLPFTEQLKLVCEDAAKNLTNLSRKIQGKPPIAEKADPAPGAAQPASSGDGGDLFGTN